MATRPVRFLRFNEAFSVIYQSIGGSKEYYYSPTRIFFEDTDYSITHVESLLDIITELASVFNGNIVYKLCSASTYEHQVIRKDIRPYISLKKLTGENYGFWDNRIRIIEPNSDVIPCFVYINF